MENRTRLLNKSLNVLIVYAAIVLLASIPAYYAITDYIWQTELNEHNHIVGELIKQNLKRLALNDEEFSVGKKLDEKLAIWNKMQPQIKLQKVAKLQPDSVYNTLKKTQYSQEIHRFQGLITYLDLCGQPYSLTVETNIEESHETIIALTIITITFFAILLVGFILLNRIISMRIWNPFYSSLEKIKNFNLKDQRELVFESTNIEEFHALNSSLEKLIAGNLFSYRQQKEFIENASHELQTPLAIIQHKLDLLIQDQLLTSKESEYIEQIQKALSRASRTNKNLLLLSKIENRQFTEMELVSLLEILTNIIELFTEKAIERRLNIIKNFESNNYKKGNRILIDILITNLVLNAIRYTPLNGEIKIYLSESNLIVSNTGDLALDSQNLFKRFAKTSTMNSNIGLGLALVKQISLEHGWGISYTFDEGMHTFRIDFE